jgi:hypothetical protein
VISKAQYKSSKRNKFYADALGHNEAQIAKFRQTVLSDRQDAGDSLLPRLRKVIRGTLALAAGGSATSSEGEIAATNSETMRVLAEILAVADDAELEGRCSMVDHDSIVQAAGTLRRIANQLTGISMGRIRAALSRLDDATEAVRGGPGCNSRPA